MISKLDIDDIFLRYVLHNAMLQRHSFSFLSLLGKQPSRFGCLTVRSQVTGPYHYLLESAGSDGVDAILLTDPVVQRQQLQQLKRQVIDMQHRLEDANARMLTAQHQLDQLIGDVQLARSGGGRGARPGLPWHTHLAVFLAALAVCLQLLLQSGHGPAAAKASAPEANTALSATSGLLLPWVAWPAALLYVGTLTRIIPGGGGATLRYLLTAAASIVVGATAVAAVSSRPVTAGLRRLLYSVLSNLGIAVGNPR